MIDRVINIQGNTLLVDNLPLVLNQVLRTLTVDSTAASGTLTVDSITGISVGKFAILGSIDEPTCELVRIHTSTAPTGNTITLNANTVYAHSAGTSFTLVDFDQIEFSVSATLAGAKTVINSTTAVSIQPDRRFSLYNTTGDTVYELVTNLYVWFRFKNSATATYSDYSSTLLKAPASRSYDTLRTIGDKAMRACREKIGDYINYDDFLDWVEDFYQELYSYKRDWRLFRTTNSSQSTTSGTNHQTLPTNVDSIDQISIGTTGESLTKVSTEQWNRLNLISSSGEPFYFYLIAREVYFYPTPNSSKTVYYTFFGQPTRVTSIDDAINATRTGLFLMSVYFRYRIFDKLVNKEKMADKWQKIFYAQLESIGSKDEEDVIGQNTSIEITKSGLFEDEEFTDNFVITTNS